MNHLIRPALYNSYHRIENATNFTSNNPGSDENERQLVNVCGNICESGDVFGEKRLIRNI